MTQAASAVKPQATAPAAPAAAAKKKRESRIPENETPTQRFNRVAEHRVNIALKALGNLGNLSGSGYEYTERHLDQIEKVITTVFGQSMARLRQKGKKKEKDRFSLSSVE